MKMDHHHDIASHGGRKGSELASSSANRLPVFVFPASISFYSDDTSSHRQLLTLYNPYDFLIKFKVLSTAPHKYSVVDPEGSIRGRCYVDIPRYHNISDEFRIWMYQPNPEGHRTGPGGNRSIPSHAIQSGYRDVTATLYPSRSQSNQSSLNFEMTQSVAGSDAGGPPVENHPWIRGTSESGSRGGLPVASRAPNAFLIAVSIACAMILLMPNSDDEKPMLLSFLPSSCIPGIHLKLCAAYVLGCVTKPLLWS